MTEVQKHWKRFGSVLFFGLIATGMFFFTDKVSFVEWGTFIAANVIGFIVADTTQQVKATVKKAE
jgi:uncharacterized membrane protein YjjB (DUF3815 family)